MRSSMVEKAGLSRLGRLLALGGLLAALTLTIAPVAGVGAQTDASQVKIKDMQIQVWPEYDQPSVLVMYAGELADNTSLPQQMSFWLPPDISINSTCSVRPDGTHNNETSQAKIEKGEGSTIVSYPVLEKKFHIEFYYNPLQVTGADKSFVYNFKTLNPVDNLAVEVQQPLRSSDFKIDPAAPASAPDDRGFKYYTYSYTNVTPDQAPLAMNVSYTRADSNPSVPPGSDQAAAGTSSSMDPKMLLAFVGVIVVAIGGYFAYSKTREQQPRRATAAYRGGRAGAGRAGNNVAASRASRTNASAAKSGAKRPASGGGGFCGSCGAPLNKNDRFCPVCGKKSRLATSAGDLED